MAIKYHAQQNAYPDNCLAPESYWSNLALRLSHCGASINAAYTIKLKKYSYRLPFRTGVRHDQTPLRLWSSGEYCPEPEHPPLRDVFCPRGKVAKGHAVIGIDLVTYCLTGIVGAGLAGISAARPTEQKYRWQ